MTQVEGEAKKDLALESWIETNMLTYPHSHNDMDVKDDLALEKAL